MKTIELTGSRTEPKGRQAGVSTPGKLLARKHSLSPAQVAEAKSELRKVFQLASEGIKIQMFSRAIDAVWHDLLTRVDEYVEFSLDACGHIIGHLENNGFGYIGFLDAYERRWGSLPPIWFTDESGGVSRTLQKSYEETGIVEALWDCGASHACEDEAFPTIVKNPSSQN